MPINGKAAIDNAKASLCFVVGPIGKDGSSERKHADLLLNALIKHVLENQEFQYKVKRADEDADPGMIGDRVITDIIHAPLVIADLTDLNPNAFYELGIRHSTQLPTIHVAKAGTALPFDNVTHRTIFVDLTDWHSIEQARTRLAESARAITASDYRVSNPITQANASFKMRQSDDPRDQVLAEIQERMSNLEANSRHVSDSDDGLDSTEEFDIPFDLYQAMESGDKIEAIKSYRQNYKIGLKEAKDIVEAAIDGKFREAARIHLKATGGRSLRGANDLVRAIGSAWPGNS